MTEEIPVEWDPDEPWDPFVYRAQLQREPPEDNPIVDGDTIWFRMDKGFYDYHITNVRLRTVDTREISFVSHDSEEYERGMAHKHFVEDWLAEAIEQSPDRWPFILKTYLGDQRGSYGRVLAEVHAKAHRLSLADALLKEFDDVEVYSG